MLNLVVHTTINAVNTAAADVQNWPVSERDVPSHAYMTNASTRELLSGARAAGGLPSTRSAAPNTVQAPAGACTVFGCTITR